MAYRATVIPIMIASPSDVQTEREVIRSVIHDWNCLNSAKTGIVLLPYGWDTHSSPELGTRPQELINTRILKECDLLIGVFWTRLGTPTDKSESGTVEEIEEHIASKKPAMIYFSSQPVAPDRVDTVQYQALKDFKSSCEKSGLIQVYDSIDQFKDKVLKQLHISLNNNPFLRDIIADAGNVHERYLPEQFININSLSEDAKTLLKEAATSDDGRIVRVITIGEKLINAGNSSLGGENSREFARWDHALNELVENDLVVPVGYKGEIFELTHRGWGLADELKK